MGGLWQPLPWALISLHTGILGFLREAKNSRIKFKIGRLASVVDASSNIIKKSRVNVDNVNLEEGRRLSS